MNQVYETDKNYDTACAITTLFYELNDTFDKFCSSYEC
jgi:hypothetical protein